MALMSSRTTAGMKAHVTMTLVWTRQHESASIRYTAWVYIDIDKLCVKISICPQFLHFICYRYQSRGKF